jgi:acetylornithine aminotransferase
MEGSFHGRTLATLTASGNRKIQAGFEPLVQGFYRVPYNDLESIRQIATHHQDVVAVLVEPVTGEGGVQVPDRGYLAGLRALCDERGWLMMLDEIQTGIGRTGKLFACEHEGVRPDVMTLAKGLGNGVPIGACLVRGPAMDVFKAGSHGSTFGGNPLAARVALTVLDVIERDKLAARAATLGKHITDGLRKALDGVSGVAAIRHHGLMIGIELDRPCRDIMKIALDRGLLLNVTADNVVRLLPPLVLNDAEATQIADGTAAAIREFLAA